MGQYYDNVPKDLEGNLAHRESILTKASEDRHFREYLIEVCRDDLLYWVNTFCWLYEPRPRSVDGKRQDTIIPFISWEDQDPILLALQASPSQVNELTGVVGTDLMIEKSRGAGVSWNALTVIDHETIFRRDMVSYGVVSKTLLDADNPDNPDSLSWKIDWQNRQLPGWMVPPKKWKRSITNHSLTNLVTGSSITYYSAVNNLASGGRKTVFFMDELHKFPVGADEDAMSSTEPVTNCRWLVSTPGPRGPEGAFYRAISEEASGVKIRLHWSTNKERNRGIYTIKMPFDSLADYGPGDREGFLEELKEKHVVIDGRKVFDGYPVACDPENNPFPEGYLEHFMRDIRPALAARGYDLKEEGRLRSPWYDSRCLRMRMTPRSVAQEYDINYGGSASRFFNIVNLEKLEKLCTDPTYKGELSFGDDLTPTWRKKENGDLHLWCPLTSVLEVPPDKEYVVSADVATGQTGQRSSNSTLVVVERQTGIKVAELAVRGRKPKEHAQYAIALCKFFHGAFLIWEDNGPGQSFKDEVISQHYANIYYRENLDVITRKKSNTPGWWSTPKTKRIAMTHLSYCYEKGLFFNPSRLAIREATQYQEFPNGKIAHVASESSEDPASRHDNHGDRCIADMLAAFVCIIDSDKPKNKETKVALDNPPPSSFRYRQMVARQEDRKASENIWDGKTKRSVRRGLGRGRHYG